MKTTASAYQYRMDPGPNHPILIGSHSEMP